jgi:tRNA(adenine34) deaminase
MTPEEMVGAALEVAEAGLAAGELPIEADEALGWRQRSHPLRLAVNLEPCVMCLGAAMALGVSEVSYALESPTDGGARIAETWRASPDMPSFAAPAMTGGIRREESRELFRRYCATAPDSGMRRWAQTLLGQP